MFITRHIPRSALTALAVSALLFSFCPAALQAQEAPGFAGQWDFDGAGGFGAWKPLQAGSFEIRGGLACVNAKSKRPCLDLAGPHRAEEIAAIEVRMRGVEVPRETSPNGSGDGAMGGAGGRMRVLPQLYQGTRIYFTNAPKEKYDAEKSFEVKLPLDGKFHVLTINPGEHPSWKGSIQKIRFDLGDFPHQYELDYIYFHRAQAGTRKGESGGDKSAGRVGATSTEPAK